MSQIGCRTNYGYASTVDPNMHQPYSYLSPDEGEPAWIFLEREMSYGGESVTCHIRVETLPAGVSNARIVVTKITRPSDWF